MLKLYEAVDALEIALRWMDENEEAITAAGGEIPAELLDLLEQAEGDLTEKIERSALAAKNLSAMAKAAEGEAMRLTALAKSYARQAETLEAYIQRQMHRAGIQKVQGARAKLWIQANGRPSVRLANPDVIPAAFQRISVEFDSQAAYEHLKANNAIPAPKDGPVEIDGLVVERGVHLRIK